MRRRLLLASLIAFSAAASGPAFSQAQQNFALVNRTGQQIDEVYVSSSAANSWGRDVLGTGVMPSGTRRNITFPRSTRACMFDLRVVYENGNRGEVREINLCEISTVSLSLSGGRTRFNVD